ncbi:MAG: NAD-dependent epimerase/dehydratase family protein [Deltaproteobacteria bacterium]|nr:NAD-dependent epimerase/dehydratase family protein [Deltaproteobacteria bacterium]
MGILSAKRTCLVTGVAGFVGSHLAERLLSLGHPVVGVDDFSSGSPRNLEPLKDCRGFHFHERSITERGLITEMARRHANLCICFHLAAIVSVPYSVERPEETMEVNFHATGRLLEGAVEEGLEAFVFAGSAAEYGNDQRLPLLESYAGPETRHASPYGRAKFLASEAVAASPIGVSLRCFNIFGPRQDPSSPYSGVISKFMDMALRGSPLTVFGDGLQTRDFIYVSDIVEAYLVAAGLSQDRDRLPHGVYNVGTGRSTSILELAQTILEVAGQQREMVFQGERPGDIRHSVASIDALKQAGGWEPKVSLREGLGRTLQWMREEMCGSSPE